MYVARIVIAIIVVIVLVGILVWLQPTAGIVGSTDTTFTDEYVEAHKGEIFVEIPEVYELANIALAITDYGLDEPYRVHKVGDYYKRVREHFLPYADHPLIAESAIADLTISEYYGFRENSFPYLFEGDSIVWGGVYPQTIWRSNGTQGNLFLDTLTLVEDFARLSDFRAFYRANEPYYQAQIDTYRTEVPVRKMWDWLDAQFPNRYGSYKIVFSPLIGASHSTQQFHDNGLSETVMFISGPEIYAARDLPPAVEEGLLSRLVFTEIDHNYINPTTQKYTERLNDAFSPMERWTEGHDASLYGSPRAVFNEYMTWATFTLYVYDTYEPADAEDIVQHGVVRTMVESRGYIRFAEFNTALLELYRKRDAGDTVADLYPMIIKWAEQQ